MTEKKHKGKEEKKEDKVNENKDERINELTGTLQRLQADFENYKKLVDKEKGVFRERVLAEVISGLLPAIDHFQLALQNTGSSKEFIKGIEMIYSQIYSLLEDYGLRPIEAAGKEFDPYRHEVLLQVASDKEDIVLEELQKGYMLNGRVLRLSKVKVGKKGDKNGNKGCMDKKGNAAEGDTKACASM